MSTLNNHKFNTEIIRKIFSDFYSRPTCFFGCIYEGVNTASYSTLKTEYTISSYVPDGISSVYLYAMRYGLRK